MEVEINGKPCTNCKIFKPYSEFYKNKNSKDTFDYRCKVCKSAAKRDYVARNRELIREKDRQYRIENADKEKERRHKYRVENLEIIHQKGKVYRELNKEKISARGKSRYESDKEKVKQINENWKSKNKERISQKGKERYNKKRDEILGKGKIYRKEHLVERREYMKLLRQRPEHRIKQNLRCRLRGALNGKPKATTTMKLVGCTPEFLKEFLEKQFTDGMSWENYGKWHIDHIIPCGLYDLSDPEQQKICFHYTNLRPLWAEENQRKNKYLDITDLLYGDVLINIFGADEH
jgi:hypothetical protein